MVGDTVRMVDWRQSQNTCALPREQVRSYPAVVAAVAGKIAVAIDLRMANAQQHLQPATVGVLQRAVATADPLVLPTMRAVFDRQFTPLSGGGGRTYVLITSVETARASDGGTGEPQAGCSVASEMTTVVYPGATPLTREEDAAQLAATIIHEIAHNAHVITSRRASAAGGPANSAPGWTAEAWAVTAEETAARIWLKQPHGARPSGLTAGAPAANVLGELWARAPRISPWTTTGMYNLGAAILLYARERNGDARYDSDAPLLYQRLAGVHSGSYDPATVFAEVARVIGMAPADLMDAWTLAHATDGLIEAGAAGAKGLPQFGSWATEDLAASGNGPRGGAANSPVRTVSRSTSATRWLAPAPGRYDALYFLAEQGRGISFELTAASERPFVARLTRLR